MKKMISFLCLMCLMLLGLQAFSQNCEVAKERFNTTKAVLYKDDVSIEKYVKTSIFIDSAKQNVRFTVKNESFEKTVYLNVDYITSSGDSGYLMHLSNNSSLAIEPSLLGNYCKLTMHTPREEYDKMVFLFYQIE